MCDKTSYSNKSSSFQISIPNQWPHKRTHPSTESLASLACLNNSNNILSVPQNGETSVRCSAENQAIPMKMVHPFFVEFDESTCPMSNTRSQDLTGRMQRPVVSSINLAWREKYSVITPSPSRSMAANLEVTQSFPEALVELTNGEPFGLRQPPSQSQQKTLHSNYQWKEEGRRNTSMATAGCSATTVGAVLLD